MTVVAVMMAHGSYGIMYGSYDGKGGRSKRRRVCVKRSTRSGGRVAVRSELVGVSLRAQAADALLGREPVLAEPRVVRVVVLA